MLDRSSIGISDGGIGAECERSSISNLTAAFGGTCGGSPKEPTSIILMLLITDCGASECRGSSPAK